MACAVHGMNDVAAPTCMHNDHHSPYFIIIVRVARVECGICGGMT